MAIYDTYIEFILEKIIRDILIEGKIPSIVNITNSYNNYIANNDVSKPLFDPVNFRVARGEASSAIKYNNANKTIQQDLLVLYKHLFKISDKAINNFARWQTESNLLEIKLNNLENRIKSLLLLQEDTSGYFSYLQDDFIDTSEVDLTETTAYINTSKSIACIGTSLKGATRIDLSYLLENDIEFNILTKNNLVSLTQTNLSNIKNVVSDSRNFWQARVYTNKPTIMTTELKINFKETKEISRIDIDLHMSNQSSAVQLTPLYSMDSYSWYQLPVNNPTVSIIDKISFQFNPINAQYVKFIMNKAGYDQVHKDLYLYEFGADSIAFYNEAFEKDTEYTLISKPLYVTDKYGNINEFNKVALDVCEEVPKGTSIDYYITVSNDETVPISSSKFVGISPSNSRANTNSVQYPSILNFGNIESAVIPSVGISYNSIANSNEFINPMKTFNLVTNVTNDTVSSVTANSSASRYTFANSNERILNYQISQDIAITNGSFEVFRNVCTKNDDTKVRGYSNGWGYSDPYYLTTITVENNSGIEVDFGSKPIYIDEAPLTGRNIISYGYHTVKVHKNNWKAINYNNVSSLLDMKAEDSLYPYNHRYLIEGYDYPNTWTEEKIYTGFDIIAEYLMKEVSIFDMAYSVAANDYSKYSIDLDVADPGRTGTTNKNPTKVIVIKVDENNPDFINEKFMIRFKVANSLYRYLRFKAIFKTTDSNITPYLDFYRLKISS